MSESGELEKQLRCKFRKALRDYKTGNVVDILIDIIREDYILLAKEQCSCWDCVHCQELKFTLPSHRCSKFECYISDFSRAYNCDDYFSGRGEARKSIARMRSDLTREWILE